MAAPKSVRVSVPASSANLGPGFDCMAAAVDFWLELVVTEADEFSIEHDLDYPRDRENLLVKAFERVRSADGLRFEVKTDIPGSGGLGSSASAIVAGLAAAAALDSGSSEPEALLALATDIEGHADNVAAALLGGFVIVDEGAAASIKPPADLSAIFVIPHESVSTKKARAALPEQVSLADATCNVAAASSLVLGLERGDHELIQRSLRDKLHQPHRASLFPRSSQLVASAEELGALGATISGAGPTVMLWVAEENASSVLEEATTAAGGWAEVRKAGFVGSGVIFNRPN